MRNLYLIVSIILFSSSLNAGVSELGLSYSYVNSEINESNYTQRNSVTFSYSYYLGASTAIELSYTSAEYKNSSGADVASAEISTGVFEFIGLDFVYGFADRKAQFQPYIKAGALHMDKQYFAESQSVARQQTACVTGVAPSAGLGFKIRMTQTFSFKLSFDGSTQPITNHCDNITSDDDLSNLDYSAKAGISWFF